MAVNPDRAEQGENRSPVDAGRESYGPLEVDRRRKDDGRGLILYETRTPAGETGRGEGSAG